MKTLDLIRYITQHPEYRWVDFVDEATCDSPMEAICELASIDPSHYDSMLWRINGTLEEETLLVYKQ